MRMLILVINGFGLLILPMEPIVVLSLSVTSWVSIQYAFGVISVLATLRKVHHCDVFSNCG